MTTASGPLATTSSATDDPRLLVRGLAAAGIATVVNVVLLLVASGAGASMVVAMGAEITIGIGPVIGATLVPLAIGAVVAWLLARRWPRTTPILAWVGLGVAVLSIVSPLTAALEITSGLTLAIMHLIAGGSYFAALMSRR